MKFQGQSAHCTYASSILGIEVGDFLVVQYQPKSGPVRYSIVEVVQVDAELEIAPNSEIEYKWVVAKLDLSDYKKLLSDNDELARTLGRAYAANLRRNFAQSLLANLPEDEKLRLDNILGAKA